ncbi:pilus assembly protein PilP [Desulfoluna spongiiphila]|uniref:Tfp pilus assembly protein PilP n=1 Tax=Desulfoluna spongiiphila TaxID=419481 RepID=A0A1G5I475_9BACT|nr:pilus assembly protein PilP [Desulfoluna spongiiphila]SCY70469.1 Tfp pilus assembly protein PilP [Desulfoluna spongiiphila]VVS92688.1 pilus assembly protein pilp [Desulfoluna spongiiphila]
MPKKIITSIVTAAFLVGPLFSGCDRADDAAQSQDTVKTFKVSKKETVPIEAKKKPTPEPEAADAASIPAVGGVPPAESAAAQPAVLSEKASDEMLYGKSSYDPAGRVDPFEPVFARGSSGTQAVEGESRPTVRQTRISRLTPLEKLDIGQLKLVGIVSMPGRSMAMVEETGGKGYVVRKGTYMGVNSGQVVEIARDRVVIEEEVENFLGKIVVRTRELKLQKPLGED